MAEEDSDAEVLKEFAESIRLKFRDEAIRARDEAYRRGFEKGRNDRIVEVKYEYLMK